MWRKWWWRLRKWWRGARSRKNAVRLRIWCTKEDAELLRYWCYRQDLELSDWMLTAALREIPVEERSKFAHRFVVGALLEAAETMRLPVSVKALPDIAKPFVPSKTHPCRHLREVFDSIYTPSNCFGRCAHSKQTGKPCFWSGGIATGCEFFDAYKKTIKKT